MTSRKGWPPRGSAAPRASRAVTAPGTGSAPPAELYLRQMELGPMQNFVYLVGDREAGECVVVDPAWEIDTIVRTAEADGVRITGALVTHTHQDHVGGSLADWGMPGRIPGVEELLDRVRAKVYVHRAEREFLRGFGSDLVQVESATDLAVGRFTITFIHTPGHTPGSQCFLVDGRLVSGDTLFIRACGRTDLPGGDPDRDAPEPHAAARAVARRHGPPARAQLRRARVHHRRREAREPVPPDGARRFPAHDGRRPDPPAQAGAATDRRNRRDARPVRDVGGEHRREPVDGPVDGASPARDRSPSSARSARSPER